MSKKKNTSVVKKKYKSFKEIPVWQLSHKLTLEIYKLTNKLPKEEKYGLVSQLRRSASSVPSNIVEGFYRNTTKELLSFLYISRGSCGETIYHLLLVKDLGYIESPEYDSLIEQYESVIKQLSGWIRSLKVKI